ncbi:MAG: BRO family protein [Moheibacter sp.]
MGEIIRALSNNFEDHSKTTENGIEFWFARDIQHLLGYSEWRNFQKVIIKAKTSCDATGSDVLDHLTLTKWSSSALEAREISVISVNKRLVLLKY